MRVAFVTPLDERSAIADYSLRALDAVAERWDFDIWYPTTNRPRWTLHPTRPFWSGSAIVRELADYDLAVYVLGNSRYHIEILAAARRHPGLVLMHDRSLAHLFLAYDDIHRHNYVSEAAERAGDEARELLRHVKAGQRRLLDPLSEMLPMTDVALQDSLGVVTHSQWMADRVAGQTLGQVTVARLPHRPPPPAPISTQEDPDGPVTLVVAGAVNENKCVERVVRAMGSSPLLRRRGRLRVVGPITRERRVALAALAQAEGVERSVELLGALPRAPFDAVVRSADVFLCLRDPVLEAMSASLLEGLATARPVVVYNQGHYAELPDDAVVKVDPSAGPDRLREALEALIKDPERAALVGRRGRQHLETVHAVEQYAEALTIAASHAIATRPMVLAVGRGRQLVGRLGIAERTVARNRVALVISRILPDGAAALDASASTSVGHLESRPSPLASTRPRGHGPFPKDGATKDQT